MRKTRQLHLWIGLFCSIFILIESVTGLFLLEPWLLGDNQRTERGAFERQVQQQTQKSAALNTDTNTSSSAEGTDANSFPGKGSFNPEREGGAGVSGIVRNLHEGRIGNTDISWVMDLAAIGMIFLTITGIILSTKTLAAQSGRRRKRKLEHQS